VDETNSECVVRTDKRPAVLGRTFFAGGTGGTNLKTGDSMRLRGEEGGEVAGTTFKPGVRATRERPVVLGRMCVIGGSSR